jgi:hypothetical protein
MDSKAQVIRSAYFLKTDELGGNIQESLKAEAKIRDKKEFESVSFQYTGQTGKELKSIDGTFKKDIMDIIRIKGKEKKTEKYKNPPDTFLSTFLPFQMLQLGIKVGKQFKYSAVAEEEGASYDGVATVKSEEKFAGQNVFRVKNSFKNADFTSFITAKGEMLGTIMEKQKLKLVLVSQPSEATDGFPVPNKTLILTFGNIPSGKENVLARGPRVEVAPIANPTPSKPSRVPPKKE